MYIRNCLFVGRLAFRNRTFPNWIWDSQNRHYITIILCISLFTFLSLTISPYFSHSLSLSVYISQIHSTLLDHSFLFSFSFSLSFSPLLSFLSLSSYPSLYLSLLSPLTLLSIFLSSHPFIFLNLSFSLTFLMNVPVRSNISSNSSLSMKVSAYKKAYPPTSRVNFSIALIAETASYLELIREEFRLFTNCDTKVRITRNQ